MKRTIALLTVIVAASSCSAVQGEQDEANFGSESDDATVVVFDDDAVEGDTAVTTVPAIEVGSASIDEDGAASEAIDFVSTELYSRSDIDGQALFGGGSVIATFVQPGCEFSSEHSDLLSEAAQADDGVTYVFVHSGADSESFAQFVTEAELDGDNIIHLDDNNGDLSYRFGIDEYPSTLLVDSDGQLSSTVGALDSDRLGKALAIVS